MTSTTAAGLLSQGQYKANYDATSGAFTAFNNILKRYYEGPTRDLINSTRVLVRLVNRDVEGISVVGSDITTSVRTRRNVGRKYTREGARMPTAGKQSYQQLRWSTRYNYGVCQFTGQAVSASRSTRGSFLNAMDSEINGLAEDLQHGEQRVLYGNGSGRLAAIQSDSVNGSGQSVLVLENPGGIASQALGTQYLEIEDRVCILHGSQEGDAVYGTSAADWAVGGGVRSFTIEEIDYTSGAATLSEDVSADITAGDYLYVARDANIPSASFLDSDTNRGIEMNGLHGIVSDEDPPLQRPGTDPLPWRGFGNLGVAAEPRHKAFIVSNGGVPRAWDQTLLQQAMDGLAQSGNGTVKVWLTTHGIRRQFASELIAQRRYTPTLDLGGGFKAVSWNGIPMVVDKDCTRGTVYGLDPSTLTIAKESDWNFLDEDGRVLQRIDGYDAFEVTIRRYAEFVCTVRNRNCRIDDIQDT